MQNAKGDHSWILREVDGRCSCLLHHTAAAVEMKLTLQLPAVAAECIAHLLFPPPLLCRSIELRGVHLYDTTMLAINCRLYVYFTVQCATVLQCAGLSVYTVQLIWQCAVCSSPAGEFALCAADTAAGECAVDRAGCR